MLKKQLGHSELRKVKGTLTEENILTLTECVHMKGRKLEIDFRTLVYWQVFNNQLSINICRYIYRPIDTH